jgi:hypothetical protein
MAGVVMVADGTYKLLSDIGYQLGVLTGQVSAFKDTLHTQTERLEQGEIRMNTIQESVNSIPCKNGQMMCDLSKTQYNLQSQSQTQEFKVEDIVSTSHFKIWMAVGTAIGGTLCGVIIVIYGFLKAKGVL